MEEPRTLSTPRYLLAHLLCPEPRAGSSHQHVRGAFSDCSRCRDISAGSVHLPQGCAVLTPHTAPADLRVGPLSQVGRQRPTRPWSPSLRSCVLPACGWCSGFSSPPCLMRSTPRTTELAASPGLPEDSEHTHVFIRKEVLAFRGGQRRSLGPEAAESRNASAPS